MADNWMYEYKIRYYDKVSEKETENMGVVYASSYKDAMESIANWYGEDQVISVIVKLSEFDGPLYEFPTKE